jgi:hypothetical protein
LGVTSVEAIKAMISDERKASSVVVDVFVEDGSESVDACEFRWTGVSKFESESAVERKKEKGVQEK